MPAVLQAYRVTDETVALLAAVSTSSAGRVQIAADGRLVKGPQLSGSAALRAGPRLLYAIAPVVAFSATLAFLDEAGEVLAELRSPIGASTPWIDLDAIVEVMDDQSDRLTFLRQIAEGGASILKLAKVVRFRELRALALDAAARMSPYCQVERAIRLGGGLVLWVLRGPTPSRVESVQLQDDRDLVASPFKPMALPTGGDAAAVDSARCVLLTDGLAEVFTERRLLLWGRRSLSSADTAATPRFGRSGLLPLVQSLGVEGPNLVGYLVAALAPHLAKRPDLRVLLTEMAAMSAPRAVRPLLSDRPLGLGIDLAVVAENGQLFASGWAFDPCGLIRSVAWIHSSGQRAPVSERWVRLRPAGLPDRYRTHERIADAFRFVATVAGPPSAAFVRQQTFEVTLHSGATFEVVAPPAPQTPADARDAVLSSVTDEELDDAVVEHVLEPAVRVLHRAHLAGERVRETITVGDVPEHPAVSVVVPLYKALEFLRYQITALATGAGCDGLEFVLVLDSPDQALEVEARMRALHAMYGVAARIVVHHRNLGYAPAVNTGVARSRAGTVILLNSDVVPAADGWIGALRSRLADDVGAVGPKLLFHDDSIQHAGMAFARDLRGGYFNRHTFKGYPRDFVPASQARPVAALTGACLMLRREMFEAVGGLCEDYVVGDFEDSDFSFRIASTGRSLWYEPAAELYHYERQSIAQSDSYTKTRACGYNRWLHSRRWRQELDRLTQEPPAVGGAAGAGAGAGHGGDPRLVVAEG